MGNFKAGAGTGIVRFAEELFPIQGFCGVHDEPHVRVLYLEQEEKWAVAAFEIVMLPDGIITKCRECIAEILDMKVENVWLHMTHAITTPHTPIGFDAGQEEEVRRKAELFEQALLQAAKDAAGRAEASIRAAYFLGCARKSVYFVGRKVGRACAVLHGGFRRPDSKRGCPV